MTSTVESSSLTIQHKPGRVTIIRALIGVGSALAIGLLGLAAITLIALEELRIGGANYAQIMDGKDLVADVLPPPEYIIEPYLLARLAYDSPEKREEYKSRFASLRKDFDTRKAYWEASGIPRVLRDQLTVNSAREAETFWDELDRSYLPALEKGDRAAAAESLAKLDAAYAAHRKIIDEIVSAANTYLQGVERGAIDRSNTIQMTLIGSVGLLIFAVMASLFAAWRFVVSPITRMTGCLAELAAERYETEVPCGGRGDEIGHMASCIALLKQAATDKVRAEKEAADTRNIIELERSMRENEAQRIAAANDFAKAFSTALQRMSGGDLTCRIDATLAHQYEKICTDFNAAVERLQLAMQRVVSGINSVRTETREIASASEEQARRAALQAANLEETAAALALVTATVQKTAQGSGEARGIVSAAKNDAERSAGVVQQAVSAMSSVESSSRQISRIIGVIDEIAFQTNLLALNAGVEAARAGEAGRGFAVVASEVRALAQRSAEAAKEIKELISASAAHVGQGVAMVAESGKVLEQIVSRVAEINSSVLEIAAGAQDQANTLKSVNGSVSEMDLATQKNAAAAEETTTACHNLAGEIEELAELIAGFNVGQRHDREWKASPGDRQRVAA